MAIQMTNQGVQGINMNPYMGNWTSDFSTLWNGEESKADNWIRAEQSANNALLRDLYYMQESNKFNAYQAAIDRGFQSDEAQKNRDWQEFMRGSNYQAMVDDLKKAGLSPILAVGSNANTPSGATPSGSRASSSGGRTSGQSVNNNSGGGLLSFIANLISIGAGLYNSSANNTARMLLEDKRHDNAMSQIYYKRYTSDIFDGDSKKRKK